MWFRFRLHVCFGPLADISRNHLEVSELPSAINGWLLRYVCSVRRFGAQRGELNLISDALLERLLAAAPFSRRPMRWVLLEMTLQLIIRKCPAIILIRTPGMQAGRIPRAPRTVPA